MSNNLLKNGLRIKYDYTIDYLALPGNDRKRAGTSSGSCFMQF